MTTQELEASIQDLKDIRNKAAEGHHTVDEVERLIYDLDKYYKDEYENLPKACRNAFDEIVTRRIAAFPALGNADTVLLNKFKANWKSRAKSASLKIHFGQMRVGPDFQGQQGGGNVAQQDIVGFPAGIIGRAINAVQGDIHAGVVMQDQIPVFIFWWDKKQHWVCANNRGYTAHCKASKWPSRLIPRVASQDEINRLSEKKIVGQGGFTYADGYPGARLREAERTLPSTEMPITTGPNTWVIEDVVEVPHGWR
jgi:hypothetical protein